MSPGKAPVQIKVLNRFKGAESDLPPKPAAAAPAIKVLNKVAAPVPVKEEPLPPLDPAATGADLLRKVISPSASSKARSLAARHIGEFVVRDGPAALLADSLLSGLRAALEDEDEPTSREGALLAYEQLCILAGTSVEAHLLPWLPAILERFSDKAVPVRSAAKAATKALGESLCPNAFRLVLPMLFEGMAKPRNWQTKVGALLILRSLTKTAPRQLAAALPEIMPNVSECLCDARADVKKAAMEAMTDACLVVGNRDVEPFVPALLSCISRPSETQDCIHKLGAITFVQAVEAPTLAVLVPLLVRGLKEKNKAVLRKTAIIVDNMSKLVYNPADAHVFLPRLLPGLEKASNEVPDPEVRLVVTKALGTLIRVAGGDESAHAAAEQAEASTSEPTAPTGPDPLEVIAKLKEVLKSAIGRVANDFESVNVEYAGQLACEFVGAKNWAVEDWKKCVTPYLIAALGEVDGKAVGKAFLDRCEDDAREHVVEEDDDEEGEEICNCEFSLAYGGRMLLNKTTLQLRRGRRYGLCGANGAGKSTLMKAIASGKLEGFPPKDVLRSAYVEHDIDASLSEMGIVDFVFTDPNLQGMSAPSREEVERVLQSVGFDEELIQKPIAALSGGWKMKLALARAMLMKADVYLLDEPTNHLDTTNVAWLENYLTHLPRVTSMIVSHDSGFLDNVCTDIIHYESLKLKRYKGNLSEFVKVKPEAMSYYQLAAASLKFVLPKPGYLEGVKSRESAILKMKDVSFTYPGAEKPQLSGVTIRCSLNSRVAVLGRNGAGKSTLIKMMTGETEADTGSFWKHPNMRIAYVAQHAFHHIEEHLEKTPLQYMQWRYAIGEDREGLKKVNRKMSHEDLTRFEKGIVYGGETKHVDTLNSRRKLKKGFEYEVIWQHRSKTDWLPREMLEELGYSKLVNEFDMREAARLALQAKPFMAADIQKHLSEFGLDTEIGSHSHIRGLSGGQKVKVVLAAAMWNNPHMLVLDEPTNYLDRDSLGALATAIKEYGGGVVMISHNAEFTDELCTETWLVADGKVTVKGRVTGSGTGVNAHVAAEEAVVESGEAKEVEKEMDADTFAALAAAKADKEAKAKAKADAKAQKALLRYRKKF